MMTALPIYCLTLSLPQPAVARLEAALDGLDGALAIGLPDRHGEVRLQAYFGEDPGRAEITARLAAVALACGIAPPAFTFELMPEIDWVAESQAALPPVRAGRFYVHGSHVATPPPYGSHALLIDANVAFGTGRHETTKACLLALGDLARRHAMRRVLDLGCGSGILALGARCLWPAARVVAADNDPDAVRMTRLNARANRLERGLETLLSEGYRNPALRAGGAFDLIVANILARPLCALAPATARHLRRGGRAVLSGLLVAQERQVLAAHLQAGLLLERRQRLAEWSALVLRKR
jgi:ribosomal protein L11 methyltransferase